MLLQVRVQVFLRLLVQLVWKAVQHLVRYHEQLIVVLLGIKAALGAHARAVRRIPWLRRALGLVRHAFLGGFGRSQQVLLGMLQA